jgi:hypothetical protein
MRSDATVVDLLHSSPCSCISIAQPASGQADFRVWVWVGANKRSVNAAVRLPRRLLLSSVLALSTTFTRLHHILVNNDPHTFTHEICFMSDIHDDEYEPVRPAAGRGYPSPPESTHSMRDSNESLRALEFSDGPSDMPLRGAGRVRSYSMAGFDFQAEMLPLSESREASTPAGAEVVDKNIGVVKGDCIMCAIASDSNLHLAISLVMGLQARPLF